MALSHTEQLSPVEYVFELVKYLLTRAELFVLGCRGGMAARVLVFHYCGLGAIQDSVLYVG